MAPTELPTGLPESIISPTLAKQRIAEFLKKKKPVLDRLLGYKPEIDHLTYSVPVFLELLDLLTKEPGRYSGMRVYFASQRWSLDDHSASYIPSNRDENITLIFVPTIKISQKGVTVNQDDLAHCYFIAHNRLIRLPKPGTGEPAREKDIASHWVKRYQEKLGALAADGACVTGNAAFKDTKCLWYEIGIFVDGKNGPGLINHIKELQRDTKNPLEAIVAHLACYTKTDTTIDGKPLAYQMTLLFELKQNGIQLPDTPKPACFGTKHKIDEVAADQAMLDATPAQPGPGMAVEAAVTTARPQVAMAMVPVATLEASDTGFPCPPAICSGSLLPQA